MRTLRVRAEGCELAHTPPSHPIPTPRQRQRERDEVPENSQLDDTWRCRDGQGRTEAETKGNAICTQASNTEANK